MNEHLREPLSVDFCAGIAFAIKGEDAFFPGFDEELANKEAVLETTRGVFVLCQHTLTRNARLLPGNYDRANAALQADIPREEWDKFAENQVLALFQLEEIAGRALFAAAPTTEEGWLNLEEGKTELRIKGQVAKSMIGALNAQFCELCLEGQQLARPDRSLNKAIEARELLGIITNLLTQLSEQEMPISQELLRCFQEHADPPAQSLGRRKF
jgi:hypothetical protein